jgi:hypothetical protein
MSCEVQVRFCERLVVKFRRPTHPHISGKNGLGRFMVRRTTIRKRMRSKLRDVKQQLRKRMHDPVPQTGQWLKSVVQGYFNPSTTTRYQETSRAWGCSGIG